jgi:hypothetical protein
MARFQDLSVDLLYVIISYLQADKRLLRDVALSSRLFRDISQRFIVRDVTISDRPALSRSKLFLRTLEERPDLIAHVHRLELDLLRENTHWPEELNNVNRLARLLINLREFCYLSRDYKVWHYELPFPLTWNSELAHEQVRRIDWNHNMTVETLYKCMQLPRIASIYCRELHGMNTTNPMTEPTIFNLPLHQAGRSSLTELRVDSAIGLPCEAFRSILRSPRCLRKLTLEFQDELSAGLQADRVSWLLEPVQTTLQELNITSQMGSWRTEAAHAPSDFSAFAILRKLQIPLRYLIGRGTGETGDILCPIGILPLRLCELKIGFFSTGSNRSSHSPSAIRNIEALGGWLRSLQMEQEQLTDLTHVFLQETGFKAYYGDLQMDSVRDTEALFGTVKDSRVVICVLPCLTRVALGRF